MHLHTEHSPSARIRNRVRWQDDDFFAWLHKLHSAISLNLSEWGSSNFLPQLCSHTENVYCSSGAGVASLGVASVAMVFWQHLYASWKSVSELLSPPAPLVIIAEDAQVSACTCRSRTLRFDLGQLTQLWSLADKYKHIGELHVSSTCIPPLTPGGSHDAGITHRPSQLHPLLAIHCRNF